MIIPSGAVSEHVSAPYSHINQVSAQRVSKCPERLLKKADQQSTVETSPEDMCTKH